MLLWSIYYFETRERLKLTNIVECSSKIRASHPILNKRQLSFSNSRNPLSSQEGNFILFYFMFTTIGVHISTASPNYGVTYMIQMEEGSKVLDPQEVVAIHSQELKRFCQIPTCL
jgi:hypothetical protein